MKVGIVPFWLFAAIIVSFAGVATDLAIAGAAIGVCMNVGFVTRNLRAVSAVFLPVAIIAVRYLILPVISGEGSPQPPALLLFLTSWLGLVIASSLALAWAYVIGLRWLYGDSN